MNERRAPRTLPIRRWLALALVVTLAVPLLVTGFLVFHLAGVADEFDETPRAAERTLRAGASRWNDPNWQAGTQAELAADGVDFILIEGGQEVYRSTADPLAADNESGRLVTVVELTATGQRAYIFSAADIGPPQDIWLAPLVGFTALLLTLAGIAWVLGYTVIRPLAATSRAARQVAGGNLDVDVPTSRVREVEEVSAAFTVMGDGLRESVRQQAELEQERRLFIGAVAHDLRTPLFALRGALEGLQTGLADTPEKRSRYVAMAQEKANALERLIQDLFDYTRLEYLDQAPKREQFDLVALLAHIVDGARPQADSKEVTLTFDAQSIACPVDGDPHLVTRAVQNLVDNAMRFAPNGGAVTVSCRLADTRVEFAVADDGPGIPPADLAHIFSPMFRGETSRNRSTGGAGLGLTIARRILRAHNGDLTARNDAAGAVFTGWLPGVQAQQGRSMASHASAAPSARSEPNDS